MEPWCLAISGQKFSEPPWWKGKHFSRTDWEEWDPRLAWSEGDKLQWIHRAQYEKFFPMILGNGILRLSTPGPALIEHDKLFHSVLEKLNQRGHSIYVEIDGVTIRRNKMHEQVQKAVRAELWEADILPLLIAYSDNWQWRSVYWELDFMGRLSTFGGQVLDTVRQCHKLPSQLFFHLTFCRRGTSDEEYLQFQHELTSIMLQRGMRIGGMDYTANCGEAKEYEGKKGAPMASIMAEFHKVPYIDDKMCGRRILE